MCLPAFRVRCQSSAALHWVVHNNPKGRFEFMIEHPAGVEVSAASDLVPYTISIRALQGHSGELSMFINPDLAMTPVTQANMP
eukprot:8666994-Lingulodinium_polyedra.AAC.1